MTSPARWLVRLSVLTLLCVLGAIVAKVVTTMRSVQPVQATVPHISGVVWGDRVFLDQQPLSRWLTFRGVSYPVWASRHPKATRLLADKRLKRH